MWIWLAVGSAVMLGFYDVAKKQALKRNNVFAILLMATGFSAVLTSPFLSHGCLQWHLQLVLKAALVSLSWISGLAALKELPLTTASTIKASRPVLVLMFSIIIFGERLNAWQWAGCILAGLSLFMLSRSSKNEGIGWKGNKGILYMVISVFTGVASALFDKHILSYMPPLFVQSWCNWYITGLMGIIILIRRLADKTNAVRLRWDWTLPVIAILITVADYMYFVAVHQPDALLSVISMIRRSCVIVTFVCGAILFREKNIRSKAMDLLVMLVGMALIVFGTV